ncbi:MAG: class I SAM-dependent methyltransferase [Bryobacteraceae bacterium]
MTIRTAVSTEAEYTVRDQERMRRANRYFEWQFRLAEEQLGKRVLEIGCGLGNFTRYLIGREIVVGIDIVPECIEGHRAALPDQPNLVRKCLDVLDPQFLQLRQYSPDSIACLNVLEHISDDLLALQHMNAVLPRGGRAVFIVPAFRALYGPIDEKLGHFRRYTRSSMRRLAHAAGFKPVLLRYLNSAGFVGWWVNAHILKKDRTIRGANRALR